MKIQPLESADDDQIRGFETITNGKVGKSRLKRLFDRQFQRVLKITDGGGGGGAAAAAEVEPSSVCLAKMVQNFIEENDKLQPSSTKCGRSRCNCFKSNNLNITDDDDIHHVDIPCHQSLDLLKSLVPCSSVAERNLLADTSIIFEKNKLHKRKDEEMRRIVAECLASLGYDASVCKSRWDKSPSHPAGEYEYIDVNVEEGRLFIDVDFRSEFQIARPTGSYKALLQALPFFFVGKADRLQRIVNIMSDAARQSLKQKGMPCPPWRKAEYMKSKWLAPYARDREVEAEVKDAVMVEKEEVTAAEWRPPAVRVKSAEKVGKAVTGLASLLKGKP